MHGQCQTQSAFFKNKLKHIKNQNITVQLYKLFDIAVCIFPFFSCNPTLHKSYQVSLNIKQLRCLIL